MNEVSEKVLEMAQNGASQRLIAEKLNISLSRVNRIMKNSCPDADFFEEETHSADFSVDGDDVSPYEPPHERICPDVSERVFALAEKAVETQNRLNGQLTAMAIRAEEAKNSAISEAAELRGSVAAKEREIARSRAYSVASFALAFVSLPVAFECGFLARSIAIQFSDYLRVWVYSGIALTAGLFGGIALMVLARKRGVANPDETETEKEH